MSKPGPKPGSKNFPWTSKHIQTVGTLAKAGLSDRDIAAAITYYERLPVTRSSVCSFRSRWGIPGMQSEVRRAQENRYQNLSRHKQQERLPV